MANGTKYNVDIELNLYSGTKKGLSQVTKNIRTLATDISKGISEVKKLPEGSIERFTKELDVFSKVGALKEQAALLKEGLGFKNTIEYARKFDKISRLKRARDSLIDYQIKQANITKQYQENLLYFKKMSAATAKARAVFNSYFGLMLSSLFVFRSFSNAINGFIRQSVNSYLQMASSNDAAYQSIMRLRGGFEALKYSFVQVLTQTEVFNTLLKYLRSLKDIFENMTPEKQKFVVNFILFSGAVSFVISKLAEIGILLLALKPAIAALKPTIASVSAALASASAGTIALIAAVVVAVIGAIINIKEVIKDFLSFFKDIGELAKKFWSSMWHGIRDIASGFMDILKGDFKRGFLKIGLGIANIFLGAIEGMLNIGIEMIRLFLNTSIDAINGVFKGIDWVAEKLGGNFDFRIKWKAPKLNLDLTSKLIELSDRLAKSEPTGSNNTIINNVSVSVESSFGTESPSYLNDVSTGVVEAISTALKTSGVGYY